MDVRQKTANGIATMMPADRLVAGLSYRPPPVAVQASPRAADAPALPVICVMCMGDTEIEVLRAPPDPQTAEPHACPRCHATGALPSDASDDAFSRVGDPCCPTCGDYPTFDEEGRPTRCPSCKLLARVVFAKGHGHSWMLEEADAS